MNAAPEAPPAPIATPDPDEEELRLAGPPPPAWDRIRGVLLDPAEAFSRHEGSWGWALPWALVAVIGVLHGLLVLAVVDIGERAKSRFERGEDMRSASSRRTAEKEEKESPEIKDARDSGRKFVVFAEKLRLVLGPPVIGVVHLVAVGGVVFVAAFLLGPKASRGDLLRALSAAAWVSLAEIPGYLLRSVGALAGNPAPETSPVHLVDPLDAPVLAAALSRLDPVIGYYYLLLGLALACSLRLGPVRAALVSLGLYGAVSFLFIALALVGKLLGGGA